MTGKVAGDPHWPTRQGLTSSSLGEVGLASDWASEAIGHGADEAGLHATMNDAAF